MHVLSTDELRMVCPVKWHENIPTNGISLGVADVDFSGPISVNSFIKDNLKDDYSFYGHQNGSPSAINSGIEYLTNLGIDDVSKKSIQVIPGTMVGIYVSMEWISRKKGSVAILNPLYPPIHTHANITGNKIKWFDILSDSDSPKGWNFNPEKLKEVANQINMIILNNPNNPTGHVYSKEELAFLRDLAVDHNLHCFVDELYEPLIFDSKHIPLVSLDGMEDRCITLYGFSKAYGLAGYRSGFMHIASPEIKNIKYIVEQLLVSPSPLESLVMEYALTHPDADTWKREFAISMKENTSKATKLLNNAGIKCDKPQGCFFVFPNLNIQDDKKFSEDLLIKEGVQVVPGIEFGPNGEGYIRINCATSWERLEIGLNKIIKFWKTF